MKGFIYSSQDGNTKYAQKSLGNQTHQETRRWENNIKINIRETSCNDEG